MELQKIFDCIYTRPYAEDDYLLNDYVDFFIYDVLVDLYRRQDECVINIAHRNPPMLKDNIIDILKEECQKKAYWIFDYIIAQVLIRLRLSNIDLGEEGEWALKDFLGEETYNEFEHAARKYIFEDYAKFLGVEKTIEYFTKINRPEFIAEVKNE